MRWQVYRRLARRGFVRVAQSMGDRVEVASLGCWLVVVGTGREARLRLGTGVGGAELFPTEAEAESARAEAETARAEAETARAEAEANARAAAEAEVARLRALLAAKG